MVIEREFRTSWVHQGYLEPQSCSAMLDPLGNLTVYASTQALFHTRSQVAHVLGLADHQVTLNAHAGRRRVRRQVRVPRSRRSRRMAMAVRRPVRMAYTRMEEFVGRRPGAREPDARQDRRAGTTAR